MEVKAKKKKKKKKKRKAKKSVRFAEPVSTVFGQTRRSSSPASLFPASEPMYAGIPTPKARPIPAKLYAVVDVPFSDRVFNEVEDEVCPSFEPPVPFTQEEMDEVECLVPTHYHDFLTAFHPTAGLTTMPKEREWDMEINLKPGAKPKNCPLYELTQDQTEVLRSTLAREVEAGRLRPSNSPWASPVFFVRKKDGTWRMVVDYRYINSLTINDAYPLPLISEILADLGASRWFTTFDIMSAYQQLRMKFGSIPFTAFKTKFGSFESTVVRDGLKCAPATFQRWIQAIFADLIGTGVVVYIDDIIIHAKTLDELRRLTKKVLRRIIDAGLYLKAKKCLFEQSMVKFLGFVVSGEGISADKSYVDGVISYPRPIDTRGVRGFLGLAGYYRRFVSKFADIARPLHHLTRNHVSWCWGVEQENAFQELKRKMTEAPVLAHFDPTLETIVQTDASSAAWAFVISQINKQGEEHPVAMESGAFKDAQVRYTTTEKEFLAIVMAFQKKRHLLMQVNAIVITDHHNLRYWMEPRQLNERQARWFDFLQMFTFKIVYRPGTRAMFPDALSCREDYRKGKVSKNRDFFIQALPEETEEIETTTSLGHLLLAVTSDNVSTTEAGTNGDETVIDNWFTQEELVEALAEDEDLDPVRDELMNHTTIGPASKTLSKFLNTLGISTSTSFGTDGQGILRINGKIYVPNRPGMRLRVLKTFHESPIVGHQGQAKTKGLIRRHYTWPLLPTEVDKYLAGCAVCQRTKPSRIQAHGHLNTLQIPEAP